MKKVIKSILIVIVVLFAVYNIIWLYYYSKFVPFRKSISQKDTNGLYTYTDEKTGYSYEVYAPNYLRFNGNLAISPLHDYSLSDVTYVTLLIWPKFFSGYKVGVMMDIIEEVSGNPEDGEYSVTSHRLEYEVDENMNPLQDYDEDYWAEFENNKDFIKSYFDMAYNKWGILKIG